MIQTVDFTKHADKLFNDSFYEIRKAKTRFVVIYGGSGSGKSVSVHQSELINQFDADYNTLLLRKYASDLLDSCYSLLQNIADRFSVTEHFKFVYSQLKRRVTNIHTGYGFVLKGLDDTEKIKSIVGLKRVVIEEASQLDFKDFREVNRRVRGIQGIQILMILNPIDENHWIKKNFVDPTGAYHKDTTVLIYNYQANKFLTEDDIAELERLKLVDINEYNIYVLGKWGVKDNKRAWLYNFEREKHIVPDLPFYPSFPVYLSFDFNNEPFTCVAAQMSPSKGTSQSFLHIIKEFSGNWKVEEMCQRIKATFPASLFYVTGDRSGQNEDIGRNQTLFQMIASLLGVHVNQLNLNTTNLTYADSRLLCNSLFGAYPNIKISEKGCPNLAVQCQNALVDEEAAAKLNKPSVLKKDRQDHKNDEFDGMRYLFQTYFHKFAKETYFKVLSKK